MAPGLRLVHLAVSNGWDYVWQVHHGALSLDAHVLPIIGPPFHDHETLETTPKDERAYRTIFVTSTRMRYPWMYPSASRVNPEKWLMTVARRQNAMKSKRR